MATSCEELTHWKRPWCWEGLGAGGEGDDRGWDGWMASLTRWTWVWVNSGSWWWTGRPGVLQFMGSQRVGHNWVTELSWIIGDNEHLFICFLAICLLWRNVCLGLLPIFWLGCLFVWYWVTQALYVFWRLIFCKLLHLHILSPILRVVFSFCLCFLCCAKAFKFS